MSIISKPNVTTNGTTADGSKVSANFDTIYNDYNGNITDPNIAASGITTYGKVGGSALSSLGSINAGAGTIPAANLPSIPVKATGAEIVTGTDDAKFATPKALKDANVALQTAVADYSATSTVVGFSAFTTKLISTKKIGKTCIVDFDLYGASNSVNTTLTVPWLKSSLSSGAGILSLTYDNGSYKTTPGFFTLATQTITIYSDYSGTLWTATGDKHVRGQVIYEEA